MFYTKRLRFYFIVSIIVHVQIPKAMPKIFISIFILINIFKIQAQEKFVSIEDLIVLNVEVQKEINTLNRYRNIRNIILLFE